MLHDSNTAVVHAPRRGPNCSASWPAPTQAPPPPQKINRESVNTHAPDRARPPSGYSRGPILFLFLFSCRCCPSTTHLLRLLEKTPPRRKKTKQQPGGGGAVRVLPRASRRGRTPAARRKRARIRERRRCQGRGRLAAASGRRRPGCRGRRGYRREGQPGGQPEPARGDAVAQALGAPGPPRARLPGGLSLGSR